MLSKGRTIFLFDSGKEDLILRNAKIPKGRKSIVVFRELFVSARLMRMISCRAERRKIK